MRRGRIFPFIADTPTPMCRCRPKALFSKRERFKTCSAVPVIRVAAKDSFVPAAPNPEAMVLSSAEDLRLGVKQALEF